MKNKLAVVAAILAVFAVAIAQPAHAQSITTRTDQASYTPGGSGTLYITVVNQSPTQTLEIRNITIYFPWAGYIDGKWASGGNVSYNLSPYQVLTTSASPGGGNIYLYNVQFTIPSWYGSFGSSNCPGGSTSTRYGVYAGCVLLGTNTNGLRYESMSFGVSMAIPTYQAPSFIDTLLPTATFAVLVVSTGLIFMAWTSL
ncbi:MAG TPA: hypothetical protein VE177_07370, partial [Candidatus Binatus sp.]|nr:hypothetical protein [Candidatus Binatus sp.]